MDLIIVIIELILVDLILGGDNAIVISMATKNLPKNLKLKASLYGTICAILLRMLFIVIIIFLGEFNIFFLSILAGALLIKIAMDMMNPKEEEVNITSSQNLITAIKTIVVADAIMSFDNAISIISVANKANVNATVEILLILFALLISFPIIIFGAQLLTKIIDKFKFIIYIFGFLLIHIGVELMLKDSLFKHFGMEINHNIEGYVTWIIALIIFLMTIIINKEVAKKQN